MIREIKLYREPYGWNARFINAPEIIEMMGTDLVPTAFSERVDGLTVKYKMEVLNPGFLVSIVS